MKKTFFVVLIFTLATALTQAPLWAKGHKFQIPKQTTLNGVELAKGQYELKLTDDNIAEIYQGKKLIVTSKVSVESLASSVDGIRVFFGIGGALEEMQIKKAKFVFLDDSQLAPSASSN